VPALDVNLDDVRATFETNVFGVMAMVATFADQLIAAQGLIVNVGSNSSVTPYVFASTYCATKGALASYSRTLRAELRPFGVRVMVVMAGTVRTTTPNRQTWELRPGSLYKPIEDVYKWRMGFSQQANIDTVEFAERLAGNVLAAETPGFLSFLNRWIGRRDWYWDGGMAFSTWFATTFAGEWLIDAVCYRMFKMTKLEKIVQAQRLEGKKTI
jgi:1-acylglycerone phosphate reductase